MIRLLISFIIGLFVAAFPAGAEECPVSGGLVFKSHQVTKENRTSVYFPDNKPLSFKRYLKFEFDYKFYDNPEGLFGHICNLTLDNGQCIDFMLNVLYNQGQAVSVLDNHKVVFQKKIFLDNPLDGKWRHVSFEFLPDDRHLVVRLDNDRVEIQLDTDCNRKVFLNFGAGSSQSSQDVAAFAMKDLKIYSAPDKLKYEWRFNEHGNGFCLDECTGKKIVVDNPIWIRDLHSRWTREDTFDMGYSYIVKGSEDKLFIVSSDSLYSYDFASKRHIAFPNERPLHLISNMSNNFLYNPDSSRVEYFNPIAGSEAFSYFSEEDDRWIPDFPSDNKWSSHNCLRYIDGEYYHMLGYGHHEYSNDIYIRRKDGQIDTIATDGVIAPRYLSASGVYGNEIYICSGVGNDYGPQMMGTEIKNDLFSIHLDTRKIGQIKDAVLPAREVAAHNLVFQDSTSFFSLFFNPFRDRSYLVLKQIFLDGRKPEFYCDTLHYRFHDMNSEAALYKTEKKFYAVTKHQIGTDHYEYNIYSTLLPVFPLDIIPDKSGRAWMWYVFLGLIVVGMLTGFHIILLRKRSRVAEVIPAGSPVPVQESPENEYVDLAEIEFSKERTREAGIYLLGGFRVIDRESKDVTGEFTPIMKQLLSLIILYTVLDDRGVSNTKLKDMLWMDKSDESAINNRSVNIRKIRLRLSQIGEFKLTTKNSYWKFVMPEDGICDVCMVCPYLRMVNSGEIGINSETVRNLVRIAALGVLLPNQTLDFFDDLKSAYSNLVIDAMNKALEKTSDDNVRLSLAKSILHFSPLDEDAIQEECISLINLGKNGLAKSSFDTFVKEYETMMGEKFFTDFEHFIKK